MKISMLAVWPAVPSVLDWISHSWWRGWVAIATLYGSPYSIVFGNANVVAFAGGATVWPLLVRVRPAFVRFRIVPLIVNCSLPPHAASPSASAPKMATRTKDDFIVFS